MKVLQLYLLFAALAIVVFAPPLKAGGGLTRTHVDPSQTTEVAPWPSAGLELSQPMEQALVSGNSAFSTAERKALRRASLSEDRLKEVVGAHGPYVVLSGLFLIALIVAIVWLLTEVVEVEVREKS